MSKTNPASDQLLLGDDYIADLLVQDAADYALRYSAHGLDALKPEKPSSLQPKPNTRFLRNIIKATDSHNAALLAKEAAESRVRLNKLDNPVDERKHRSHSSKEASRRQFGAINAILGGQHKGRLAFTVSISILVSVSVKKPPPVPITNSLQTLPSAPVFLGALKESTSVSFATPI
ncbi:uncharacterized protein BROUX77_004570 [Berkeleyomyces rouxiae]|uniref:uncharacterized protein n=1 Tax=Berkeleyomyces rouxiae TaxID=2035830 RepID=UPI003B76FEAF